MDFGRRSAHPVCGRADLCLLTDALLAQVLAELHAHGVIPLSGIVPHTGAQDAVQSVYLRYPDGNLLEISHYPFPPAAENP